MEIKCDVNKTKKMVLNHRLSSPNFTRVAESGSTIGEINTVYLYSGWCNIPLSDNVVTYIVDETTQLLADSLTGSAAMNKGGDLVEDVTHEIVTSSGQYLGFYNAKSNSLYLPRLQMSKRGITLFKTLCELPFIKRVTRRDKTIVDKPKVFLGSDPEFVFWDGSESIYALNVLRDYNFCDDRNRCNSSQEIGTDGHPGTGELRPLPSLSAEGLVQNINDLLEELSIIPHALDCVGTDKEIGCHIHFGHPKFTIDLNRTNLVKIIDYYLGKPTLNLSGPARGGYKRLGSYESKRYGFEYRSFAGTIMSDKKFFLLITKACEKIACDYLMGKVFNFNPDDEVTDSELAEYISDIPYFREYIKTGYSSKIGRTYTLWGLEEKRKYLPRRINFRDEWNPIVSLFVNGHPLTLICNSFFGFAERRGDVIAIPKDVSVVNGFANVREGSGIGIPRRLRTDVSAIPELKSLLDAILAIYEGGS